jgi:hypothetical protein
MRKFVNGCNFSDSSAMLRHNVDKHGDAHAQWVLGWRLRHGSEGVLQDRVEAERLFRLSAEQGHVLAQFSLGIMYQVGEGVPQSHHCAEYWYRRAASQDLRCAQRALDTLFDKHTAGAQHKLNIDDAARAYLVEDEGGAAPAQPHLPEHETSAASAQPPEGSSCAVQALSPEGTSREAPVHPREAEASAPGDAGISQEVRDKLEVCIQDTLFCDRYPRKKEHPHTHVLDIHIKTHTHAHTHTHTHTHTHNHT